MSFWRLGGDVIFECDHKGCKEEFDSATSDFRGAVEQAKDAFWFFDHSDRGWAHFCPQHNPMMAYYEKSQ